MTQDLKLVNPRRRFLTNMGLVSAGAVLAGCAPAVAQRPAKTNLDTSILNFALNLEYLEAAFYAAAVGRLAEVQSLGGGAAINLPAGFNPTANNNNPIGLRPDILAAVQEVADDEIKHVRFLRQVLGANAVNRPVIDLNASFLAAGRLASGGTVSNGTVTGGSITNFNPYANELFFLHGAFIFEDVGVTAYKGAARFIVDDSANGVLEQAAGILAVEAYHSGAIRSLLYTIRGEPAVAGLTVAQVVQAISDLRDSVDGTDDRDQGITGNNAAGNPNTGASVANIVPTDANAVAFSRTPRQVANIVFLSTGLSGGFFPSGITPDAGTTALLNIQ